MVAKFHDARFLAQTLDKDIYISPTGQNVFPIWGPSGGIIPVNVFYLKDRTVDWPTGDLGRENTSAQFRHEGVYAVEVPNDCSYEEALEHARDVVSR